MKGRGCSSDFHLGSESEVLDNQLHQCCVSSLHVSEGDCFSCLLLTICLLYDDFGSCVFAENGPDMFFVL